MIGHTAMLRASIESFDQLLTPKPIVVGTGATGVAHDAELMAFTDAVVLRDHDEYPSARAALETAIGSDATDRAALVAGNFSMMNRALDAIGAPVDTAHDPLATEMGVTVPDHLRRG